jgi:hypothetical protein
MTQFVYLPTDGGKVKYVTGTRDPSKPLMDILGEPVDRTESAEYYLFKKKENLAVFEAIISQDKLDPINVVVTVCSNDASYLDRSLDELLKSLCISESSVELPQQEKLFILSFLKDGYDEFIQERGSVN